MAGKAFKDGPEYVANSATNIYVPSANTVARIRHIHLTNKDSSARTVTLYVGATGGSAGGTEILKDKSIAVGDTYDLYFPAGLLLTASDFLTGICSAASAVVVTTSGELEAA